MQKKGGTVDEGEGVDNPSPTGQKPVGNQALYNPERVFTPDPPSPKM
jgi:hypothetical protein